MNAVTRRRLTAEIVQSYPDEKIQAKPESVKSAFLRLCEQFETRLNYDIESSKVVNSVLKVYYKLLNNNWTIESPYKNSSYCLRFNPGKNECVDAAAIWLWNTKDNQPIHQELLIANIAPSTPPFVAAGEDPKIDENIGVFPDFSDSNHRKFQIMRHNPVKKSLCPIFVTSSKRECQSIKDLFHLISISYKINHPVANDILNQFGIDDIFV